MKSKTLAELVLAGAFLIMPQHISNSSGQFHKERAYEHLAWMNATPLEKAGLEIYGENPRALGVEFIDFYRGVYSDKRDISNPIGFEDLERKTEEELKKGLLLKDELENKYKILLRENKLDTIDSKWGKLTEAYQDIPKGTYTPWDHEALDIFIQEGSEVLAPFNGVVVASGDYWQGTFVKGQISTWNNKGLTPRAGNSVIIYNDNDRGYLLISHFKDGLLVKTGDVVSKGQVLGYVGHSGSASIKNHGEHIHVAYKLRDREGYSKATDFSNLVKK